MIKEAIERLVQFGRDDAKTRQAYTRIDHPTIPGAAILIDGDGKQEVFPAARRWRANVMESGAIPFAVVAWFDHLKDQGAFTAGETMPVTLFASDALWSVKLGKASWFGDRVHFNPLVSKGFAKLRAWSDGDGGYGHEDFIEFCQQEISVPDAFVGIMRKLRFKGEQDAASVAESNRTYVSRAAQMEALTQGAGPIPDKVNVSLPIFDNIDSQITVECRVAINLKNQAIRLLAHRPMLLNALKESISSEAAKVADDCIDSLKEAKFDAVVRWIPGKEGTNP